MPKNLSQTCLNLNDDVNWNSGIARYTFNEIRVHCLII